MEIVDRIHYTDIGPERRYCIGIELESREEVLELAKTLGNRAAIELLGKDRSDDARLQRASAHQTLLVQSQLMSLLVEHGLEAPFTFIPKDPDTTDIINAGLELPKHGLASRVLTNAVGDVRGW